MAILDNWTELQDVLVDTYGPFALSGSFGAECQYLKAALAKTEELWDRNLAKVKETKLVMLSEAPLFGSNETYFYNPKSPFTSFFHFNDAKAVLGDSFAGGQQFSTEQVKKEFLHTKLAEAGFVVLDLFPFALNPRHTALTFGSLSAKEYETLFLRTRGLYFTPKLMELIRYGIPNFAFRYQRVRKRLERHVKETAQMVIGNTYGSDEQVAIDTIYSTNMTLDREKLRTLYKTSDCAS